MSDSDYVEQQLVPVPDEEISVSRSPLPQLYDPEQQVIAMEKAVKYGPRLVDARNKLIRMFTFSQDWTKFGDSDKAKACLSAAGAMRIADKGNFPIRFFEVKSMKEQIRDKDNSVIGYRYVYEGYASLGDRIVFAVGQYSTRDALLGKTSAGFRDPQEINESHIRQAAHTYFKGNAIKDLLGLKGIPWEEFERLTGSIGQSADKASTVTHASGTRGGTSNDERSMQVEAQQLLVGLAARNIVIAASEQGGKIVTAAETVGSELADYASNQKDPYLTVAQASLRSLTTFIGKDGKTVVGITDFGRLKGKQLEFLLKNINKIMKELPPDDDWEKNLPQ